MSLIAAGSSSKRITLTLLIVVAAVFVLYQVYAISVPLGGPPDLHAGSDSPPSAITKNIVQIDVLNGCGVAGTGQKATSFLRAAGYDVIEMGNYKTFDVKQSLVIDRSGNSEVARKLATDLGIDPKNVVQQISPEYFVTASIVIGKDFKNLRGWK